MNLIRIAIRIASGRLATLPPLKELQETVESVINDVDDPEMVDLLQEIIEACESGSTKAYLLMEDFEELKDEAAMEGHGVRHTPYDMVDSYDNRAASVHLW